MNDARGVCGTSAPFKPNFQTESDSSHRIEASAPEDPRSTRIPPSAPVAVFLLIKILSSLTSNVSEEIMVEEPETVRLPATVRLPLMSVTLMVSGRIVASTTPSSFVITIRFALSSDPPSIVTPLIGSRARIRDKFIGQY